MYLGFLTACLPKVSLEEKIYWAKENGFAALELACWPRESDRDYQASDIDIRHLDAQKAGQIRRLADENGIKLSSIAYYENNLDHNPQKRRMINEYTYRCIDAAALLGIETMGTFIGRDIDKTYAENMQTFKAVFTPMVQYAADKGVKLMFENCPMIGWQKEGEPGTISYTPELWDELFTLVPHPNFGINFDPSHLHHQLIDYLPLIARYKDRIFHVHAKDAEVFEDKLHELGVYNARLTAESWWRFRMPGLGQVDFKAMIEALRQNDYEGVISIEHEDPLYEGSEAKIYEGLVLGRDFLKPLL